MLELISQIATLKQHGKQIGGLFDCEIRVVLNYTIKDGMRDYKPVKKIEARSYWLVEPVKNNEFEVEFYQIFMNDLILIDAGKVVIDFPDCHTLDQRLHAPIEVRWIGVKY